MTVSPDLTPRGPDRSQTPVDPRSPHRPTRLTVTIRPGAAVGVTALGLLAALLWLPEMASGYPQSAYLAGGLSAAALLFAIVTLGEVVRVGVAARNGAPVAPVEVRAFGPVPSRITDPTRRALGRAAAAELLATGLPSAALVPLALLLHSSERTALLGAVLGWVGGIGLLLTVLHALPITRMAGARLHTALWWRRDRSRAAAEHRTANVGFAVAIAVIVGAAFAVPLLGWSALWVGILGWFTLIATAAERRRTRQPHDDHGTRQPHDDHGNTHGK